MYSKPEVKKQIEGLQERINEKLDKYGIEFTNEILKLSEDLDMIINIWNQICKKKPEFIRNSHSA